MIQIGMSQTSKPNPDKMTDKQGTQIQDHGQIASMAFAPGWSKGEPATFNGQGGRSWLQVSADRDPRASVCFYYRGLKESPAEGKNFHEILALPAHILRPAEIKSLDVVLRGKNDPEQFRLTDARTEDLNGKRVLIVEGREMKNQDRIYAILVDADGTGRVIQEIYFQAPSEPYLEYLKEAKLALKSIQWI